MADDEKKTQPHRWRWVRWLLIGIGTVVLAVVVFHAPILRAVIRWYAGHYASGQNLKLQFRLEGDPIERVALHNIHATATGPSALRSLDANLVEVDYNLVDLAFHGISDALKNVEVHDLTAVVDPAKAPAPTPTPTPTPKKTSFPAYFPDRLVLKNINLTVREQPQDLLVRNLTLTLYPSKPGELQIGKLQIPGVHTWTDIHATTTYANKDLVIHNLVLDQNNQLQTVDLNASQLASGKLGLSLQGTLGGGNVATQMTLSTKGSSYSTATKMHASNISLDQLGKSLGQSPGALSGQVKNVDLDLKGTVNKPATWNGHISADLNNVRQNQFKLDHVKIDASAENGNATIRQAQVDIGKNHLQLRGSLQLPKTLQGFGRSPGNLQFSLDAPDLQQMTSSLPTPASGQLQASGNLKIENHVAHVDASATGSQIHYGPAAIGSLSAKISAEKKMPPPNENKAPPIYENLRSKINAQLNDVRYGNYAVDQVDANINTDGAKVSLAPVSITRGSNVLRLSGDVHLPSPNEKLIDQPLDLQFSLAAPNLGEFWQAGAAKKVSGALEGNGAVQSRKGVLSGWANLYGHDIAAQKLVVKQLDVQLSIANNVVYLNDLTASLNANDYIAAYGQAGLKKPYPYSGHLTANLANLSTLEPLLAAAGKKTPLAGSLVVNWSGQGEAAKFQNHGDLTLKLDHGRYGNLQNLQANIQAHYTPEQLNVPIIFLGSDKFDFQATLQAQDSRLEVNKIQIDQGKSKYATAYISLPFVWGNLGTSRPLFVPNGKVAVNLETANLDLKKLFQDLGATAPATGQLSLKLNAEGPLDQLQADMKLQLQDLKTAAAQGFAPAKVNIEAQLAKNELTVNGTVDQAQIQPVQITAKAPVNVAQVIRNRKLNEQTPVSARVQMPRSSVNFIRQFVPGVRQLDGTLAMDVKVGGTIAKPALSGAADMHLNVVRMDNPTIPDLTNFNAQLSFSGDTLRIERFGGDLAGGPFSVSGKITLPRLTAPNFDLHLKANSILVARNDSLTVRIDADISVEGPMKAATVKGRVETTNSRFFKNIDIIPIALPGRPAPHPEPPSAAPTLSFPNPPLRNWNFDITVKSREPFLIRGNLATGGAVVNMRMTGTGLHPKLEGQVRLENFEATLPFSTLTINLGFLYFNPDDPLNPRIEMQGTSLVRDYTIHVYIYGTANAPKAVFSSEPPLPQEEIISLLATGTTREELGQGNVLASRAAILLVKELYRKIFKKGAEPERSNSFFSRLDVEFGNTDPRTGEQTATAKYKVSDHIVLVGDLGVEGGFRGLVKYLIRFR